MCKVHLTRNALRCHSCDQIIESKYRHDFKSCKGKHYWVDGGRAYLRRLIDDKIPNEGFTDLSEWDERCNCDATRGEGADV